MIVHTELGRYEVEEIGRGRFRIRRVTDMPSLDLGYASRLDTNEWADLPTPVMLTLGAAMIWDNEGKQRPEVSYNRITRIEP